MAQAQGWELVELARRELDLGSDVLGDLATLIEQHFAVDVALSPMGTEVDGLCPLRRRGAHALDAVRSQRLGLSVVAALLEVEDDERLWNDIMGDVTAGAEGDDVVL